MDEPVSDPCGLEAEKARTPPPPRRLDGPEGERVQEAGGGPVGVVDVPRDEERLVDLDGWFRPRRMVSSLLFKLSGEPDVGAGLRAEL